MALSENQKRKLEPFLKYKCPLCGGHVMHQVNPAQLLFFPYEACADTDTSDIKKAEIREYLVGECQNCGFTMLRDLEILFDKAKKREVVTEE